MLTDDDVKALEELASSRGFDRCCIAIRRALAEHEAFKALQGVLVGNTGLSAILEASRLRKLHPLSQSQ